MPDPINRSGSLATQSLSGANPAMDEAWKSYYEAEENYRKAQRELERLRREWNLNCDENPFWGTDNATLEKMRNKAMTHQRHAATTRNQEFMNGFVRAGFAALFGFLAFIALPILGLGIALFVVAGLFALASAYSLNNAMEAGESAGKFKREAADAKAALNSADDKKKIEEFEKKQGKPPSLPQQGAGPATPNAALPAQAPAQQPALPARASQPRALAQPDSDSGSDRSKPYPRRRSGKNGRDGEDGRDGRDGRPGRRRDRDYVPDSSDSGSEDGRPSRMQWRSNPRYIPGQPDSGERHLLDIHLVDDRTEEEQEKREALWPRPDESIESWGLNVPNSADRMDDDSLNWNAADPYMGTTVSRPGTPVEDGLVRQPVALEDDSLFNPAHVASLVKKRRKYDRGLSSHNGSEDGEERASLYEDSLLGSDDNGVDGSRHSDSEQSVEALWRELENDVQRFAQELEKEISELLANRSVHGSGDEPRNSALLPMALYPRDRSSSAPLPEADHRGLYDDARERRPSSAPTVMDANQTPDSRAEWVELEPIYDVKHLRIGDLEELLQNMQDELSRMCKERFVMMQGQAEDYEERLAALHGRFQDMERGFGEALRQEREIHEAEMAGAKSIIKRYREAIPELEQALAAAQEQVAQLERTATATDEELVAARQRVADAEVELAAIHDKMQSLNINAQLDKAEIGNLKDSEQRVRVELAAAQEAARAAQERVAELERAGTATAEELATARQLVAELQQQLDDAQAVLTATLQQLEEQSRAREKIEKLEKSAQARIAALRAQQDGAVAALAGAQARVVADAEARLGALQAEHAEALEAHREALERAQSINSILQLQFNTAMQQAAELERTGAATAEELAAAREQVAGAEARLVELQAEHQEALEALRGQLEDARAEAAVGLRAAQEQVEHATRRVGELEDELAKLKQQLNTIKKAKVAAEGALLVVVREANALRTELEGSQLLLEQTEDKLRAELEKLGKQKLESDGKVKSAEEKSVAAQKRVEELQGLLATQNASILALQLQLKQANERVEAVGVEAKAAKRQFEVAMQEVKEFQMQLERAKDELEAARGEARKREIHVRRKTMEIDRLEEDLADLRRLVVSLKSELWDLDDDRAYSAEVILTSEVHLKALKKHVKNLEEDKLEAELQRDQAEADLRIALEKSEIQKEFLEKKNEHEKDASLAQARTTIERLKAQQAEELEELKARYNQLQEKSNRAERVHQKAQAQLRRDLRVAEQAQAQVKDVRQAETQTDGEYVQLKELAEANGRVQAAGVEARTAEQRLAEKDRELAEAKAAAEQEKLSALQAQRAAAQEQVMQLEQSGAKKTADLEAELEAARRRVEALEKNQAGQTIALGVRGGSLRRKTEKIVNLEEQLKEQDKVLQKLQTANATLEHQAQERKERDKTLTTDFAEKEQELSKAREELAQAQARIEGMDQMLAARRTSLQSREAQTVSQQAGEDVVAAQQARDQLAALQAQLAAVEAAAKAAEKAASYAQAQDAGELVALRRQTEELVAQIARQDALKQELENRLAKQDEGDLLALQAAEEEVLEAKREQDRLAKELAKKQAELDQALVERGVAEQRVAEITENDALELQAQRLALEAIYKAMVEELEDENHALRASLEVIAKNEGLRTRLSHSRLLSNPSGEVIEEVADLPSSSGSSNGSSGLPSSSGSDGDADSLEDGEVRTADADMLYHLRRHLEDLSAENEKLKVELNLLRTEVESPDDEPLDIADLNTSRKEHRESQARAVQAETELDTSVRELQALAAEKAELQRRLDNEKLNSELLEQNATGLTQKYQSDLAALQAKICELEAKVAAKEEVVEQKEQQAGGVQRQLEEQRTQFASQLKQLEAEKTTLEKRYSDLTEENEQKNSEKEQEIEKLKVQLSSVAQKAKLEHKEAEEVLNDIQRQLEEQRAQFVVQLERLLREKAAVDQRVVELKVSIEEDRKDEQAWAALAKENQELQRTKSDLASRLQSLERERYNLGKDLAKAEPEAAAKATQTDAPVVDVGALQERLRQAEEAAQQDAKTLDSRLGSMQQKINAWKARRQEPEAAEGFTSALKEKAKKTTNVTTTKFGDKGERSGPVVRDADRLIQDYLKKCKTDQFDKSWIVESTTDTKYKAFQRQKECLLQNLIPVVEFIPWIKNQIEQESKEKDPSEMLKKIIKRRELSSLGARKSSTNDHEMVDVLYQKYSYLADQPLWEHLVELISGMIEISKAESTSIARNRKFEEFKYQFISDILVPHTAKVMLEENAVVEGNSDIEGLSASGSTPALPLTDVNRSGLGRRSLSESAAGFGKKQ